MRYIEELIREAMDNGEFDNLPGKGKALNLAQDALVDPLTSIVTRILKQNGVSHPFIEARRAIESEVADARSGLARAWQAYQGSDYEEAWTAAMASFRDRVRAINREVRVFNLKMPSPALHGLILDADEEIRCIVDGGNPAKDRTST